MFEIYAAFPNCFALFIFIPKGSASIIGKSSLIILSIWKSSNEKLRDNKQYRIRKNTNSGTTVCYTKTIYQS